MRYTFAELNLSVLQTLVQLNERGVIPVLWEAMGVPLGEEDIQQVAGITRHLRDYPLLLMNEATIWSRAIYPLLLLSESANVQAWAQVSLRATYPAFELEGWVDGVVGNAVSGFIQSPYLIVVEAKRGLEAVSPQPAVYGAMLAAAWQNQQRVPQDEQEIFGCYTVADTWTFVHGKVAGFDADRPVLTIHRSREYSERLEAETILPILKHIVGRFS